ncbi:hypothetical protein CBR_g40098 [Chara braunii]|uniref:Uncharacterized protein n=1 Tax=Chara braunii TaxID=69332 RepID=A0A388LT08_CHABU|nr:hypothetical protein CBR_g40098 [Chara braunii]|eukprot:GBG85456.1 hypothetical protein CBR_g40098 [Chara braunii]
MQGQEGESASRLVENLEVGSVQRAGNDSSSYGRSEGGERGDERTLLHMSVATDSTTGGSVRFPLQRPHLKKLEKVREDESRGSDGGSQMWQVYVVAGYIAFQFVKRWWMGRSEDRQQPPPSQRR